MNQQVRQLSEMITKLNSYNSKLFEEITKFPREAIWNCKYCTNEYQGCEKCNPDKIQNKIQSFETKYYHIEKIKCKCIEGCENCKQKGFLILRFVNYNPYKRKDMKRSEFEAEYCDPDFEINALKEDCKEMLEKQNADYFVIDCPGYNKYDNVLNCNFVLESEKERFKTKPDNTEKLRKILLESGAVQKICDVITERIKKDRENKKNVDEELDYKIAKKLTCTFP